MNAEPRGWDKAIENCALKMLSQGSLHKGVEVRSLLYVKGGRVGVVSRLFFRTLDPGPTRNLQCSNPAVLEASWLADLEAGWPGC